MSDWAIDFGTTNTRIARWDKSIDKPLMIEIPGICQPQAETDQLEKSSNIPSVIHIMADPGFLTRLGSKGLLARHFFIGSLAQIGQKALEKNFVRPSSQFARRLKLALGESPNKTLVRISNRTYSARQATWLFFRELLAAVKKVTGERIRELVLSSPVEAFETYRAELSAILKSLGLRQLKFIDEPVAAAIGYGLTLNRQRLVLVVDFGGGTLDIALVRLTAKGLETGSSEVIGKSGAALGGNLVDQWLLSEFFQQLDYTFETESGEEADLWHRLMLTEACRVKEALFFREKETFNLMPPEEFRRFEARLRGESSLLEVSRQEVIQILTRNGLYVGLNNCLEQTLNQAKSKGIGPDAIDEVLMVGGSSLLPQVFNLFEDRFGRGRVRAWQPFEAIAYGACVYAAGRLQPADFIVHDYALLTYDPKTQEPEYTTIVPKRTPFPTQLDFWKHQLIPTCSLGEPEKLFKLIICEISNGEVDRSFVWDKTGQLHKMGGKDYDSKNRLVVKLNEANPALGYLDPAHPPSDRRPRLEVSFGVNAERWLSATVYDLRTRKFLMQEEPVVKLL